MILLNITAAMFCVLLIVLFVCIAILCINATLGVIRDNRKEWNKK